MRGFKRRLITLRGSQDVHTLLVSELREALGIHRPTAFLLGLKCLPRITGVDDQQQVAGVQTFDRLFQLFIGDAMREYSLQPLLIQFGPIARVAEVVRDKVEALRLRGAVAGEVDDHSIFGLCAFQPIKRAAF